MLVVFGIALVVLAGAVVVLFAMLAELASRLPADGGAERDTSILPVEGAVLGHLPDFWPRGLPDARRCTVLVLSTICRSCADIAAQLSADQAYAHWDELGLLVASARGAGGDEFIARHSLQRFRHYVDEDGDWVTAQFGVRSSPVALIFREGKLEAAFAFNDVAALRARVDREWRNQEKGAVV